MNGIAILYPGELGAALGRAIVQAGGAAITCLTGRSEATRARAAANGFAVVPSLDEIAQRSQIVISLVSPSSAVETAQSFATCVEWTRPHSDLATRPTFVDLNTVSPQTKERIANILSHAGIRCLDGAFFGPAKAIGRDNVLALSGPGAGQIPPLLEEIVEVHVVGEAIGQASALKMVQAIMTKALPALFLEMVCASASAGQLDPALDLMRRLYPGIMDFLERTLPTYPAHVARRVQELEEVADWLHERGQRGIMTQSAITVLERLRLAGLESSADWTFEDLLQRIADADLLSAI
jgi:L-threonate 2-dehydrogenase